MYIKVIFHRITGPLSEVVHRGNPRRAWNRTISEVKKVFENGTRNKNMVKFNELLQDNIGELFDIITEWISDLANDAIANLGLRVLYP